MNKSQSLRSIELNLQALLLQIQSLRDLQLRVAYEKLVEVQDDIHRILKQEEQ